MRDSSMLGNRFLCHTRWFARAHTLGPWAWAFATSMHDGIRSWQARTGCQTSKVGSVAFDWCYSICTLPKVWMTILMNVCMYSVVEPAEVSSYEMKVQITTWLCNDVAVQPHPSLATPTLPSWNERGVYCSEQKEGNQKNKYMYIPNDIVSVQHLAQFVVHVVSESSHMWWLPNMVSCELGTCSAFMTSLGCWNYLIASYGLTLVCTCIYICTYVNVYTIYMAWVINGMLPIDYHSVQVHG